MSLLVGVNVQKLNPWLLAPPAYAATSAMLFSLARRAISLFGRSATLGELLDPRHFYFGACSRFALAATMLLLAIAVWRKSQLMILVSLQTLFSAAFLDVLHHTGTRPEKIDFRLGYQVEIAIQLGLLAALCGLASFIVVVRGVRGQRASTAAGASGAA